MKTPRKSLSARLIVVGLALQLPACSPSEADKQPEVSNQETPRVPALTVSVVQPQSEQWAQSITANGPIKAWQEIIVSPEIGGLRVEELRFDVGAKVRRGDLLARLADSSVQADLRKNEAAVAQAQAHLRQAQSNHQRAAASEDSGALSAQQIEEYRINRDVAQATLQSAMAERDSARLRLTQTRILAQDDGVIASKSGVVGAVVASGAELYRVIRQGRLEWLPEVDARQLAFIQTGQRVQLTLPDGRESQGQVRLVSPVLDGSTGRATVHVTLNEGSGRAGMFASGKILGNDSAALTLPQTAISLRDGRAYVWLVSANDTVSSRAVTLGRTVGDRVEVLSGITARDKLVSAGGTFLSDGASVRIVEATPAEPAPKASGAVR